MSTPLIIPSVQIKRGSLVLMPELLPGEQYWAKDTNQLFIGTAEGNKDITDKYTRAETYNQDEVDGLITGLETDIAEVYVTKQMIEGQLVETHEHTITSFPTTIDKNASTNWNYKTLSKANVYLNGTKAVEEGVSITANYTRMLFSALYELGTVDCSAIVRYEAGSKEIVIEGDPGILPLTIKFELPIEDETAVNIKIAELEQKLLDEKYFIVKGQADVEVVPLGELKDKLTATAFANMTVIISGIVVVENGVSKIGGTWSIDNTNWPNPVFGHVGDINFSIGIRSNNWGTGLITSTPYWDSTFEIRIPKDKVKPEEGHTPIHELTMDAGSFEYIYTLNDQSGGGSPYWADLVQSDYFVLIDVASDFSMFIPNIKGGGDFASFMQRTTFGTVEATVYYGMLNGVPNGDTTILTIYGTYTGNPQLLLVGVIAQHMEVLK